MDSPTRRPRRSQAERRADTQRRLYDAAVECLVERGYAGMTLAEVTKRAGVSAGALWRYCQTKAGLAYAAVEHAGREERAARAADLDPTDVDAVTRMLLQPPSGVVGRAQLELLRGAASNDELRELVAHSSWTQWLDWSQQFHELVGGGPLDERSAGLIRVLSLAGVALQVFFRDEDIAGVLRGDLELWVREMLNGLPVDGSQPCLPG